MVEPRAQNIEQTVIRPLKPSLVYNKERNQPNATKKSVRINSTPEVFPISITESTWNDSLTLWPHDNQSYSSESY